VLPLRERKLRSIWRATCGQVGGNVVTGGWRELPLAGRATDDAVLYHVPHVITVRRGAGSEVSAGDDFPTKGLIGQIWPSFAFADAGSRSSSRGHFRFKSRRRVALGPFLRWPRLEAKK